MLTFVLIALLLSAGAAALVAIPLMRRKSASSPPARLAGLMAAGLLVTGAAASYVSLSNWSWSARPAADSPQAMVARLARRLEEDPQDQDGWLLLGRSYVALEQPRHAIRAYQRANELSGGRNVEALIGMAEALILEDDAALDGRAGQLIEQALQLDPQSSKALFFGAAAALRRGDLRLARGRFAAMLETNPPQAIRTILEEQIAGIDAQLEAAPATAEPQPTREESRNDTPATVRVSVTLSPALKVSAPPAAPLFVIVREPGRGGPPLAVKRVESRFPQLIELTAADSMLAGREISAGQEVEVIARIALGGSATARSGDPFGQIRYRVGQPNPTEIVIDRLTP